MTARYDVLIVGSGHAGAQTAITLRQLGFEGRITIAGADANLPYERPPLSKEYLAGDRPFEKMLLRPAKFWVEADITLLTGVSVTQVDPAVRFVTFADGRSAGYGTLVWAAGGDARPLSCDGHHLAGVHTVRTRADVDAVLSDLPAAAHIVVVGGGFIGMEAAAVLTKLGKSVTLLEAHERVLARVCGSEISSFYEAEHRARGVDVRTGASVTAIHSNDNKRVASVELADGARIACDMVIVGIGIIPAVEPLRAAGVDCAPAAMVDVAGRTSLPGIYAIGDCASRPSGHALVPSVRIESVQNANLMGIAAATDIMGGQLAAEPVPWFWSNQFDLKLQTAGINIGYDRTVVHGDPASRSFAVAYLHEDRLLAIDCINAPKIFAASKKRLSEQSRIDLENFADTSTPAVKG